MYPQVEILRQMAAELGAFEDSVVALCLHKKLFQKSGSSYHRDQITKLREKIAKQRRDIVNGNMERIIKGL